MKGRLIGFTAEVGTLSLDEFLRANCDNQSLFKHSNLERMLCVHESDREFIGVLLTIHDKAKFCQMKMSGKPKISVRNLAGTNRMVDFNYFVINRQSRKGIYQQYSGACGLTAFGNLLNRKYVDQIKTMQFAAQNELREQTGKPPTAKQLTEIRKRIHGTLSLRMIVSQEEFPELVREMKKVRSFAYDFETLSVNEPSMTLLSDAADRKRYTITFKSESPTESLKRAIIELANKREFPDISVAGTDQSGNSVTYHVEQNMTHFGKFDFDEIATEAFLDIDDINGSGIILMIREAMTKNQSYFR